MITLHNIIEAASTKIDGTLVLHKSMTVHPTFKIYKIFTYDLYIIKGENKELLFTWKESKKASSDELEAIWDVCDKSYLKVFIEWLTDDTYLALINGI